MLLHQENSRSLCRTMFALICLFLLSIAELSWCLTAPSGFTLSSNGNYVMSNSDLPSAAETWTDAQTLCNANGLKLASLHSDDDFNEVEALRGSIGASWAWLGSYMPQSGTSWGVSTVVNDDGSSFDYPLDNGGAFPWAKRDEPDGDQYLVIYDQGVNTLPSDFDQTYRVVCNEEYMTNAPTPSPTDSDSPSSAPTASPLTDAPTTNEPSTSSPTSFAPTTSNPTSSMPISAAPTTTEPSTSVPSTSALSSAAPSSSPTTPAPTLTVREEGVQDDQGGEGEVDGDNEEEEGDTAKLDEPLVEKDSDVVIAICAICTTGCVCLLLGVGFVSMRKYKQMKTLSKMDKRESVSNERVDIDGSIIPGSPVDSASSAGVDDKYTKGEEVMSVRTGQENEDKMPYTRGEIRGRSVFSDLRRGHNEIGTWLRNEVELPQYWAAFTTNGYDTLKIIKAIRSEEELEEIGIHDPQDKLRLFRAIKKLKGVIETETDGNENMNQKYQPEMEGDNTEQID